VEAAYGWLLLLYEKKRLYLKYDAHRHICLAIVKHGKVNFCLGGCKMSKAKYQLDDFLALLDNGYKDFVITVHELLMQEGYKLKIQSTKLYGLHISYSQPKIKVVKGIIVYFIIQNSKLMIRINADNHARYPDVLNRLPENILSQIDKSSDCMKAAGPQKCWQGCIGYDFHIGDKRYLKCITNCFMLDVNSENFLFLLEMIKCELKERYDSH